MKKLTALVVFALSMVACATTPTPRVEAPTVVIALPVASSTATEEEFAPLSDEDKRWAGISYPNARLLTPKQGTALCSDEEWVCNDVDEIRCICNKVTEK